MSNNDEHSSISEKLVAAYDNVIYKIYDTIDNSEESEKPHSLHQLIDKAIERTVEFGEITSEEAQKVSDYLKRDITEISNYIAEDEENELKSWFKFDLQQIEDRFIEALNSIADPTKLELNKL
ncbi:MAG: hypothetical protein HON94_11105, partial [Methylococcales bacterium]|nr:hypothetical protein [Methylococcales bacterium]